MGSKKPPFEIRRCLPIIMKKISLLLSCILLLGACSTKLGYYFLDWAIAWEVDDYVSLNHAQQRQFDALVDKVLSWHRANELARYRQQLIEISRYLQSLDAPALDRQAQGTGGVAMGSALAQSGPEPVVALPPDFWQAHLARGRAHWYRLFDYALADLLPLVSSLSDAQVRQVLAEFDRREHKLIRGYVGKTQSQRIDAADEKLTEQIRDWVGRLNEHQRQLIHDYNAQRFSTLKLWLEYRRDWLRELALALNQRHDLPQLKAKLRLLLIRPDELESEQYKLKLDQNSRAFGALLSELYLSLSPGQHRHFHRKLNKLIEDLGELAAQAD
jgi:hypothetical protein